MNLCTYRQLVVPNTMLPTCCLTMVQLTLYHWYDYFNELVSIHIFYSFQNATTNVSPNNGPLIDELPKEQETQDVNSLSELAVSGQTVKYPENEITVDGNAAMLLNVQNDEQIEAPTSIYAYFPGLAGPSGEMV